MDAPADGAGSAGAGRDTGPAPSLYDLFERFADDALGRLRNEGGRVGGRASGLIGTALEELGVAMRREIDELELRVAQLEHRLALLERKADEGEPGPPHDVDS